VAVVEIEHDGIGWRFRPTILPPDFGRADHAWIPEAFDRPVASSFETRPRGRSSG
jgi:hypothetical protein